MVTIGIIGARGFTGGELLRLCLGHPELRITYVTSESQVDLPVAETFPTLAGDGRLPGLTDLRFQAFDAARAAEAADAFFLALPDGEAMKIAPGLLAAGKKVVDLSGDFRVRDRSAYETWYKIEHRSPQLLSQAVYGLPELHPEVREARLVANPGCYPTAALLALAPLCRAGLVDPQSIVIDAKSGVSGAGGRVALKEEFAFPAVNQNFRAYGVVGHRHAAEIEQELATQVTFTPHLLPITRGLYATCYARALDAPDWQSDPGADPPLALDALIARYHDFYSSAPFVQLTGATPPEIRHVVGANHCRIGLAADPRTRRVIITSAIDNLMKGAAGQALQNMNLMLGLDETAGLRSPALYP
jgi:N-acetyl-gamma-glutamyl-phosphate reductase